MPRDVNIRLKVDTRTGQVAVEDLDGKLKRLGDRGRRTSEDIGKLNNAFAGLKSLVVGAGVAAGIAAIGRAAFRMATDVAAADDRIGKLSIRLGESTEFLSEMGFAAERSGVGFDQMVMAIQRGGRRMAEFVATGKGEAAPAFKELGLAADIAAGRFRSMEAILPALADALSNVTSETNRVRLTQKLFDSEGVQFLQVVGAGAEAVKELREEARRLGATLRNEDVKAAAEFNDAITDLHTSLRSLARDTEVTTFFTNMAKLMGRGARMVGTGVSEIGRRAEILGAGPGAGATAIPGSLRSDFEAVGGGTVESMTALRQLLAEREAADRAKRNAEAAEIFRPQVIGIEQSVGIFRGNRRNLNLFQTENLRGGRGDGGPEQLEALGEAVEDLPFKFDDLGSSLSAVTQDADLLGIGLNTAVDALATFVQQLLASQGGLGGILGSFAGAALRSSLDPSSGLVTAVATAKGAKNFTPVTTAKGLIR